MAFKGKLADPMMATKADFQNPWNFFGLFENVNDSHLAEWMRGNGLIASSMKCEVCNEDCRMVTKEDWRFGYMWRCRGSRNNSHDRGNSATRFSFETLHFDVRDIFIFMWFGAIQASLRTASLMSGMFYGHTPVNWANYLQDLCRQFMYMTCIL